MEIFASGMGMNEGPVNCQDGSLVATSLDQGKVYRVANGQTQVLAETGGGANGATEGPNGLIYIAQNGGTWPALNHVRSPAGVQVIEPTGKLRLFGECMRSPNDLCFGPDGYLYVTDPTRKPERDDGRIWRCNVETQECEQILSCDWYPNGIGFSTEDDWIYVADSRLNRIVRLPLEHPRADKMEVFLQLGQGKPDGFAFDADGNLVIACPDFSAQGTVQVYRNGKSVEIIHPGTSQLYTNLSISQDRRIYVCDANSGTVLTGDWPCAGLPLHPFR